MTPKIGLVTLGVENVEVSLAFYRDGLGFETHEYNDGDDHVMFRMDGSWLGLFPFEQLAEGARVTPDKGAFSGIVFAHNVASEADVDSVFATGDGKRVRIALIPNFATLTMERVPVEIVLDPDTDCIVTAYPT